MQPEILINPLAIIAGVIANFTLGSLWYGPLFGKTWVKEIDPEGKLKPDKSAMIKAMVLMVIGSALTAYVLTHSSQIWRPSVWGVGADEAPWFYAVMAAVFTWIGFYVPPQLTIKGFEMRSWKLFFINSAYHLVSLLIMAMILSYWR